jgi:Pyruvate/2-oxoacid:ferredoxin oxidoreductase gamma subunit
VHFLNAIDLSLKEFNQNQYVNIIMLGFAIETGRLSFIHLTHFEDVIKEWLRDCDNNLKALHIGMKEGHRIINNS